MKQILVFLTLIGLIFVNQKLNAQVEYYNEKNPRPEEVTLHPTMKNAHKGTNFSVDEVRLAHLKGLNSYVPIDVQNTFTIEKVRTMFSYYQPDVKDIDTWIVQNTTLGQDKNNWSEKTFSYLVSGPTPTTTILSGGYQSQKASGSQIGPKMIERMPYKKGDRGYAEDEQFLYLDLGQVCYLPEYQGVLVLWISLGCGNHVFPYTPPSLVVTQQVVQTQPVVEPQRAWGSDWVISIEYYTVQQPLVQMPPQNFNYCGISSQWGFNYNPCWWSPVVYYPINCWGCTSCVPQQPITNNYYYEGDTYITNEGDQIINEGDVIVINNPPVEDPDDGGPVLPPNGDDGGGPVLGENGDEDPTPDDGGGPTLGENGPNLGNNGSNNNNEDGGSNNDGGGNLGGSGMITQSKNPLNPETDKKGVGKNQNTTMSFSDLGDQVTSEAEYWNTAQADIVAEREQNSNSKPNTWNQQQPNTTGFSQQVTKNPSQNTTVQRGNGGTEIQTKPEAWVATGSGTTQNSSRTPNTTQSNASVSNPSRGNGNQSMSTTKPQTTGTTTTPVRGNGSSGTTGNNSSTTAVRQPAQSKPVNWNTTADTSPAVSRGKNPGTTTKPQTTGTTTTPVRGNGSSSTTYQPSQNTTVQRGNGGTNTSSASGKPNTGNYQTSTGSGTTSQGSTAMKGSGNYSGAKMNGGNTGGMRSFGGGSRGAVGGGSRGGRR